MNNKGTWATIGKIATIITILGFLGINEVWEIIPQINIIPDTPNIQPVTPEPVQEFNFSQTNIQYLGPIRKTMYAESNNIVCYSFKNPTGKTNSSFTLIGEWFLDGNETSYYKYKEELNYSDLFDTTRFNWNIIRNASQIRFRIGLGYDKKPIEKEVEYEILSNDKVSQYLKTEEDGSIWWDNDIIRELISKTALCGKTEEEQINEILNFVRKSMNPPLETDKEFYYNQNNIGFKESWDSKIGTSSEYSSVFASFVRSIGLPARIEKNVFDNKEYYYVEIYIEENGWLPVDVYDPNKNVGECFKIDGSLKKDIVYEHICINDLDKYITFESLSANKEKFGSVNIYYKVKNNYGKEMRTYCIKINQTYYNQENNVVFTGDNYLLDEDINLSGTTEGDVYAGYFDFENYRINLGEFSQTCS